MSCTGCPPFVRVCTGSGTTLYDPFTRTVANGWGSSPPGPAWVRFSITGQSITNWSVDGTTGVITGTSHHSSTLTFPIIRSEWYIETHLTANSAGPTSTDLMSFASATLFDFIELDIGTDGGMDFYSDVDLQTGSLGFLPGVPFAVRLQIDETGARVRVWETSGDEPVPWTFDGLSIVGPGMTTALVSAFMAGTYTVHYDNFEVRGTDFDTFDNRTIVSGTSSWGTASGGVAWTRGGSGTGRTMVDSGKGYVMCAAAPVTQIQNELAASGFTPSDDFECLMHLAAFDTATSIPDTKVIFIVHSFAGVSWGWTKPGGVPSIFVQAPGHAPTELAISATFWADLVAGGAYMRFQRQGTVVRLKLWDDTIAEPGWQLVTTKTPAATTEEISVSFISGAGSDDTHGVWYDDILFDGGGTVVCTEPAPNQLVGTELVGYGDGATTDFTIDYPYNPASLMVEVSSMLSMADPSAPDVGGFSLVPAPPLDAPIYATYRVARF